MSSVQVWNEHDAPTRPFLSTATIATWNIGMPCLRAIVRITCACKSRPIQLRRGKIKKNKNTNLTACFCGSHARLKELHNLRPRSQ
jgi:hypothetical protein